MANETEAPTSGATKGAAEQVADSPLTLEQLDFVTLIAMHYGRYGSLLTLDLAEEKYNISRKTYSSYMGTAKVRSAIKEHGIELEMYERALTSPDAWQNSTVTPIQLVAINIMTDITDQRSDKKKLQDLKLTTRQWNTWMRDPVFRQYVQDKVDNMLKHDSQHMAGMALMDRVASGDIKALEFYYEFTGKFTRKANSPESQNAVNFQAVLVRMIEIIDEECDGETAIRIGERFKTLMAATQMSAMLMADDDDSIIVPPTAAPRELTPQVQELISRTGGNT